MTRHVRDLMKPHRNRQIRERSFAVNRFNQIFDWFCCFRWVGFLLIYLVDSALLTLQRCKTPHRGEPFDWAGAIYSALSWLSLPGGTKTITKTIPAIWSYQINGDPVWPADGILLLMVFNGVNLLISAHILGTPASRRPSIQIVQLPFWNLAYSILLHRWLRNWSFAAFFELLFAKFASWMSWRSSLAWSSATCMLPVCLPRGSCIISAS